MKELDETQLARLAYEMAINIRSYKHVFADFGIDETDYYEIEKLEFYKRAKEAYTLEWNSVTSTADRVKLQGQAGSEVMMPALIKRAMREDESLVNLIESFKAVTKVGGIGTDKAEAKNIQDRFVITINLGADTEHYNKSIEINPNDVNLGASDGKTVKQSKKQAAKQLIRSTGEG